MERTLHKDLYFESDWFKKECENIFHKEWFCCGRGEDIPNIGDYKVIALGGESIFLLRSDDQKIRAFFNFCKHRGCQLLEASTSGRLKRNIICPYHSWTYNFDGSIAKTPHLDVVSTSQAVFPAEFLTSAGPLDRHAIPTPDSPVPEDRPSHDV